VPRLSAVLMVFPEPMPDETFETRECAQVSDSRGIMKRAFLAPPDVKVRDWGMAVPSDYTHPVLSNKGPVIRPTVHESE
jgi:hypothetical protein